MTAIHILKTNEILEYPVGTIVDAIAVRDAELLSITNGRVMLSGTRGPCGYVSDRYFNDGVELVYR